jgi:uncharacterized protein YndB with AHSA1/START domain
MRWVLRVLGVVAVLIALVILVGLARPRMHVAHTRATYAVPPAELWDTLTAFAAWPDWYPEIDAVRTLPDRDGRRVIELTSSWGRVAAELTVFEPPQRLQTSLATGSFRCSWTYVLEPTAAGTVLTVTERGAVDNPVIRTLMIFMDEHATMLDFHRALAVRLGVSTTVEKLEAARP